ncbi:MAG: ribosome recycling factor [Candidatus Caenarcaniphilales bacterium]|nr:ribosome recycling factor [Candidatus Caenarcaniphilales bacterium]
MSDYENRMEKAVEVVEKELMTIRTGRANPGILDRVNVDYYGSKTPLKSIANISVPKGRTLVINPFDMSALAEIEKAIIESDLGLNPSNDGKKIIITIPELTKDRREELVKQTKKIIEDGKVAIRNIRRDVLNDAKKSDEMTEDESRNFSNEVQKVTDKYIAKIDELSNSKEKELLTI